MKGIHIHTNKEPRTFPRGNNNEIAKMHVTNFKLSKTTESISTKHPQANDTPGFTNKDNFQKGENVYFPNLYKNSSSFNCLDFL